MKTENENPLSAGPIDADINDDVEGDTIAFDLQAEETVRTARALLQYLEGQKDDKEAIDETALSIYRSAIESTASANPIDFSQILATNTRILNAGFENYLIKAAKHHYSESKTELALRMQSQLIRTISAWSRLKSIQKKFEDRKTK